MVPAGTIGKRLWAHTRTWLWDTPRFPQGMIVWCHLQGVDTAAEAAMESLH